MKKQILRTIVLIFVTSFFVMGEVNATADYMGHWAQANIEAALDKGYLSGFPDGNMKPNDGITRAEFVKLVNHSLNFTETTNINFSDVQKSDWYYQEIATGVKAGYVNGTSANLFQPNAPLTREQAAKMIAHAEKYAIPDYAPVFTDVSEISAWASDAVAACVDRGVIKGMPDGRFAPKRNLTRAEAVTMIEMTLEATALHPQNIVLTHTDQDIKYRTVNNVEVGKGVGNGKIALKKVRIKGNLSIYGGGRESIYLEDVVIDGKLIVAKEDGQVRVHLSGDTSVPRTELHSGAILEEEKISENFIGFDRVDVTKNIPSGQEVLAKGEMIFELNNSNVKIEGNGKVLQEGKPMAVKKVNQTISTPAPSVPEKETPSPAPSPAPQPVPEPTPQPETNEDGDPLHAPVFHKEGNRQGLVMFKDSRNFNHEIQVRTASAASVYFIVVKTENLASITKEKVLSGVMDGEPVEIFYRLNTEAKVTRKTVIHAKRGESICVVATAAKEDERLNRLDMATRVRIFNIE